MYLLKGYRGDLVKEAISRARKDINAIERGNISDRKQVYEGNLRELIEYKIRQIFTNKDEQEALVKFVSANVNVLKYVIDEICQVYKFGAERTWNMDEPKKEDGIMVSSHKEATKNYSYVCSVSELDTALDYVDKMTMLCHDVILRHKYTKYGHAWIPMTRDQCDVVQDEDDFRRVKGVIWWEVPVNTPIGAVGDLSKLTDIKWHYATADEYRTYDANMNPIADLTKPNPYKKLNDEAKWRQLKIFYPFFDYHDSIRPDSFWKNVYDDTLMDSAAEVGVWLTYLNCQLKYSTFKQIWESSSGIGGGATAGGAKGGGGTQVLSWLAAYKAPLGGSLGILDYQCNLTMTLDCLESKLSILATTLGLPGNTFQLKPTREPGMTFYANRAATKETRQARQNYNIPRERGIGRVIQFSGNVNGGNFENYPDNAKIDQKLDPSKITVDYKEPEHKENPEEDRKNWDWLFEKGLASFTDYLVTKYPDITLEEAKNRVEINTAAMLEHTSKLRQASDYGLTGASARNKLKAKEPIEKPNE